jgi:hypothetical protein
MYLANCQFFCVRLIVFHYCLRDILILVLNLENCNPCIVLLFGISFIIKFIEEFAVNEFAV